MTTVTKSTTTTLSNSDNDYEVVTTDSPFRWFHPTHAILRHAGTGETFEWNSRDHRKMRHLRRIIRPSEAEGQPHYNYYFRWWCYEPHLVTWWINLTNMLANSFWILSSVFATWPNDNADVSGRTVYAGGILAGLFMLASCYLAYVEAINQTYSQIHEDEAAQLRHRRDGKKLLRRFVPTSMYYGRRRSPIVGLYRDGMDSEKQRKKLLRLGYPIVEVTRTGKMVRSDNFDNAISKYVKAKQK